VTERQTRFVTEYIKDGNATQAAKRAGFSKKTARPIGARLLTNVDIAAAIEKARGPVLEASQITLESHLAELARLRDRADTDGLYSAAVTAEVARGKCAGYYTERIAMTVTPGTGVLAVPAIASDAWVRAAVTQQAELARGVPVIDGATAS